MKKALSVSFAALLVAVASAQDTDTFPDIPANHWAYQALKEMKAAGFPVGYPDGLFRGHTTATRYEMASLMFSVYRNLKDRLDSMQTDLDRGGNNFDPKETYLIERIKQLTKEVDALKSYGPEIANLKRAADTFELELEQLGVNVEAMKHTLGELETRVGVLEKKKQPIDISGQTDLWFGASNSTDNYAGLSRDGRIEGNTTAGPLVNVNPPVPGSVGLLENANMVHEAAFTIGGTNDTGPKWGGTIVVSDAFGIFSRNPPLIAFGNQSDMFNPADGNANIAATGLFGYSGGQEDIYLQDGGVTIGGPKANLELGRIGYSLSPYMLQRIDNNSYYANDRWDNGQYYYDGLLGKLSLGPATFHLFGGRNSGLTSVDGVELDPLRTGPVDGPYSGGPHVASGTRLDIDRSAGIDMDLAARKLGDIDIAYIYLQSDTETPINPGANANRLAVFGADAKLHLGPIDLAGGYHKSEMADDNTLVVGSDNGAANVGISARHGSYYLFGEYREVEANYLAPGDWGRLGVLRDPTNIKGYRVGGSLDLGRRFTLSGSGEFDSGITNNYGTSTYLGSGTSIEAYQVRLDYHVKKNLSLYGAWEATHFGDIYNPQGVFVGSGDPMYRWTTFGLGYGLNTKTSFSLQYEFSDVDNDYQVTNGSSFRGGFLTSQLTFKF